MSSFGTNIHSLRDLHTFCYTSLGFYIVTYVFHNVIQVAPLGWKTVNIFMYYFQDVLSPQVLEQRISEHDAHVVR